MKANPLRRIWAEGGTVLNGWLHIPSTWSAEVMGYAGWDSLTVDMQHGLHGIETAIQMLQVISGTRAVPLARVNWNEPGSIMRLLDAGACGIICPMINTRAECEAFVGACRYPPAGYRSLGPTRAALVMGSDYAAHANDVILTIAMVETPEAIANLDAIASVPGLDMIFVGTGDLSLSMTGRVGVGDEDPAISAALDAVVASCTRHGLIAGLFTDSVADGVRMIQRGYRFVTLKTDSSILRASAQQIVQQTRDQIDLTKRVE